MPDAYVIEAAKGCKRIEGDQEVMRRARFDPKARGIVCAVKRANVIGARDQRTTSGPTGVMTRINMDALAFGLGKRRINWVLDADIRSFLDRASYCHPPYEG